MYTSTLIFESIEDNIVILNVETSLAILRVSLYGGQILSWQPKTEIHPVLWLSSSAEYQHGQAIRGGVPVCWPWFGKHPVDSVQPSHGFARLSTWIIQEIKTLIDGEVSIILSLDSAKVGSHGFADLRLHINMGSTLKISLITLNISSHQIKFTEGLHTYFKISDIDDIQIIGLHGSEYIDLYDGNRKNIQIEEIRFEGSLCRIFCQNESDCIIKDSGLMRQIRIEKSGSLTTAIWNPGLNIAQGMDDIGDWRSMICVESANALSDEVILMPGKSHIHSVVYSVQSLVE